MTSTSLKSQDYGEVAAVKTCVCGIGLTYESNIRLLLAPVSDEDEAVSINYAFQRMTVVEARILILN